MFKLLLLCFVVTVLLRVVLELLIILLFRLLLPLFMTTVAVELLGNC